MNFTEFSLALGQLLPPLTEKQLSQMEALEGLYRDWNSKINVISRKDIDSLYLHHVLHSLSIVAYLSERYPGAALGPEVLDVGTGGGFPGIPLAIMYPESHFTLCDSVGKKILVAGTIAKELGLDNVTALNARAETLPGGYDYVVSRAVTTLENFYPWVKGKFSKRILYLKGGDVVEEIAAMMGRFHMRKGQVGTWKIDSWCGNEYFEGKLVIDIAK